MKKGDAFIILAVFLLAGLTAALFLRPLGSTAGGTAVVTWDGEVAARIPLDGPGGDFAFGDHGQVVIRVEGGQARFLASDCRNQVCVHSGWLSSPGRAAACLPNRCLLEIEGQSDHDVVIRLPIPPEAAS